jgi:GT2 family glycosyltransferase
MLNRTVGQEEQDPRKRYQLWIEAHELTAERIETIRAATVAFRYRPLISVYISVHGDVIENFLTRAIDSVRTQLYDNWEACIMTDEANKDHVRTMLDRYATGDPRFKEKHFLEGDFVVFLEQHGELSRASLFELVKQLNRNPLADLIYWDEDKFDATGSRCHPFFKPDWSPDLILSMNYVGRSFAARKSLIDDIGGIRSEYGVEQTYDLVLRAAERTEAIVHIPEVLYHRRETDAASQDAPVIERALQRRGLRGRVETSQPGRHSVRYEIRDDPMVSILIPTKDKCLLLKQCIDSIAKKTDYANYEIVVLDNDSRDPETLKYFQQVSDRVRVLRCPGRFNFSAINNRGAAEARGEFLLFLNNDTEVIRPDWMRALIEQAQRPEVGAVGAKLLFRDGRIQHAGIVLGIEGGAGHAFRLMPDDVALPGLANVIRDCSAVTAACMMMRRSLFDEVGGFDEALPIDSNDVDLCLRLRQHGFLIVYTPLALLRHHESATRGRFHIQEYRELFLRRWGSYIRKGDPYYNRNLTSRPKTGTSPYRNVNGQKCVRFQVGWARAS